jgi:hypothetical protein
MMDCGQIRGFAGWGRAGIGEGGWGRSVSPPGMCLTQDPGSQRPNLVPETVRGSGPACRTIVEFNTGRVTVRNVFGAVWIGGWGNHVSVGPPNRPKVITHTFILPIPPSRISDMATFRELLWPRSADAPLSDERRMS